MTITNRLGYAGALLTAILAFANANGAAGEEMQKGGMDMSGMSMAGSADSAAPAGATTDTVRAGTLEISGAFTKAMLPGQPVGGGYLTVRNTGSADDTLLSATSPNAGAVEIHDMAMQGQIMKMRKVAGGVPLPAGQTVAFAPGGLHLMFMRLKAPFREGDTVSVTLTFDKAGAVQLTLPVEAAGPATRP
jgi:copper(I)-binding protein